jgi:uracil-DNA glycosylase
MDEELRQEIAAWLQFYRDLGIEDFYRRKPVDVPKQVTIVKPASFPSRHRAEVVPSQLLQGNSPERDIGVSLPSREPPRKEAPAPELRQTSIRPPVPSLSLFEAPPAPRSGPETLEQIREDLGDCHRCELADGRKTIVFGEGNPRAELVFVGEGPGADEDEQGRPFVGRAGQLLNRMIQAIGMKREAVYICNVVKCRPPGNRTPEKDEIETCSPFLFRQLEAIKPRLICCLGAPAVRTVLGLKEGIMKIRGRLYDFGDAKVLATVHPAYILRNPREEKILREDFEKIRKLLKT